jgi:glucose-6-phosphate-specific signal transduction histidine kinase
VPGTRYLNDRKSVTTAAVVLFAVVFVLRMTFSDPSDGLLFLGIVPIALLAAEYRVAGGLIGAAVGAVLLVAWVVTMDPDLGPAGFLTRVLTFVLVGAGVGIAVSSREERELRLRELLEAEERYASALKIHDEIVQGLTVAKMALEMDETGRAVDALDEALRSARAIVTKGVYTEEGSLRSPLSPTSPS